MIELEANTKQIALLIDECTDSLDVRQVTDAIGEMIKFFRDYHNCTMIPYNWNEHYTIYWNYLLVFDDPKQETMFRLKYTI